MFCKFIVDGPVYQHNLSCTHHFLLPRYSYRTLSQLIDVDWISTTGSGSRADRRLREIPYSCQADFTKHRAIFSPSPMLFQVIVDRVSAPRGEGGKNLHQIHQISPLKLASQHGPAPCSLPPFLRRRFDRAPSPPSFLALRGVGLVSNLSAFPHRAPLSLKSGGATALPF